VFIPVRLESTRLPGKALLNLAGKHAIEHLFDRAKLAKLPSLVVLCTTTKQEDDPLQRLAKENGIHCFRGSELDLLERLRDAATHYQVDLIVNVDGDDILVDPELVDNVANCLLRTGADFVRYDRLPLGAAPIGIKTQALKKVCELKEESFKRLYTAGAPPFCLRDVLRLLRENPDIAKINAGLDERYWRHFMEAPVPRIKKPDQRAG